MLRQGRNALQEKEAGYQSKIRKRRDQMAVQVNKQIHDEMGKIATRRELELVLTYPGAQSKEEEDDLADAMHRVQAPAVWVGWYSPKLDITEELIAALNNDYPPRENQ